VSKLRIILVASLIILGVLIGITVFQPMATGEEYSQVQRAQLLETEDECIIQFDIINGEGEDTSYIINWSTGEETYSERVFIKEGHRFTSIQHFYPETVKDGKVHLTICKEGEATPFEDCTYYIRFD
jgi:hypothetical protein